jgi:hypothetical protein
MRPPDRVKRQSRGGDHPDALSFRHRRQNDKLPKRQAATFVNFDKGSVNPQVFLMGREAGYLASFVVVAMLEGVAVAVNSRLIRPFHGENSS